MTNAVEAQSFSEHGDLCRHTACLSSNS